VTLIHLRSQLLPPFGQRPHHHLLDFFIKHGIKVAFQERSQIIAGDVAAKDKNTLRFADGRVKAFGLIVSFTLML